MNWLKKLFGIGQNQRTQPNDGNPVMQNNYPQINITDFGRQNPPPFMANVNNDMDNPVMMGGVPQNNMEDNNMPVLAPIGQLDEDNGPAHDEPDPVVNQNPGPTIGQKLQDLADAQDTSYNPPGFESNPYEYNVETYEDAYTRLNNATGEVSFSARHSDNSYVKIVEKLREYIDAKHNGENKQQMKARLQRLEEMCAIWLARNAQNQSKADKTAAINDFLQNCVEKDKQRRNIPYINGLNMIVNHCDGKLSQHTMNFEIDADFPEDNFPHHDGTLDGLNFEYWEKIHVFYDYQDTGDDTLNQQKEAQGKGGQTKDWNDIYANASNVGTFKSINNFKKDGVFKGPTKAYFKDIPGLSATNGKNKKRLLEFRIVISNEAGQRKEIYCNQYIVNKGEQTVVSAFNFDENNNSITSKMGDRNQTNNAVERRFDLNIPQNAFDELPAFVQSVKGGTADEFDYYEFAYAKALANTSNEDYESGDITETREKLKQIALMGDRAVGQGAMSAQIAGINCMAMPEPGDQFFCKTVNGNEKIVAIKSGEKIRKLYYTDNVAKNRRIGDEGTTIVPARSFREIPIECANLTIG